MSLDIAYMRRSVDAAVGLAMRDERAWSKFDLTTDGFYRSFAAFLLVAPLNILIDLIVARRMQSGQQPSAQAYGLGDAVFSTLTLAAQWLLIVLVLLVVLRFLGLGQRYSALIIAHNWGTVVVALLNLPALLLYAVGVLSVDQTLNVNFVVLGLTLYYRYYIAQTALGAGWSIAAGITMLDFLVLIYFAYGVSRVQHLWVPA